MTVMSIAIMAIVAAFSSGTVALNRASQASTAATLADIQMEGFRQMTYASIAPTCAAGTSATNPVPCFSSVPKTGPDGRTYRLDSAVRFDCLVGTLGGTIPPAPPPATPPTCGTGAPPVKLVTIVVFDPAPTPAKELFRETSTFDQATG